MGISFSGLHAKLGTERYTVITSFDREASQAGRRLETSGPAIPQQATMPVALDSTLNRGFSVSTFLPGNTNLPIGGFAGPNANWEIGVPRFVQDARAMPSGTADLAID
jgi:hypothetical protein